MKNFYQHDPYPSVAQIRQQWREFSTTAHPEPDYRGAIHFLYELGYIWTGKNWYMPACNEHAPQQEGIRTSVEALCSYIATHGTMGARFRDIPLGGKVFCTCCGKSVKKSIQYACHEICEKCWGTVVSAAPLPDDVAKMVEKALRRAWNLGQTYWQQADSDFTSQHKKADETHEKFKTLVVDTTTDPVTILALLDEREKLLKVAEAAKKEQFKSRGLREAIEELEK